MSTSAQWPEGKNPKTGMTQAEMKEFIRNHFEEFVNRKNVSIGEVNFAPGFVDHGADVRPAGKHRGPNCRGRQSGGSQPLDGNRCGIEAAARILWNCHMENRQPADRGTLGLPRDSAPRARLVVAEAHLGCIEACPPGEAGAAFGVILPVALPSLVLVEYPDGRGCPIP